MEFPEYNQVIETIEQNFFSFNSKLKQYKLREY